MAKGLLYLTSDVYNEDFYGKEVYERYLEDIKSWCDDDFQILDYEEWRDRQVEMESECFFDNVRFSTFGECTIKGSVGAWDGRHEIMPVKCKDLYAALIKCLNNQDGYEVKSYKTFVEVTTYNHDSQYHGGNCFRIYPKEKRKDCYLF